MKLLSAFLIVVLALAVVRADTGTKGDTAAGADSRVAEMEALKKQVNDAETAYSDAGRKRLPDDQVEQLWKTYAGLNQTNLPRIFQLASEEPASPVAYEMFGWIVTNRQITMSSLETYGFQSLELLAKYHVTETNLAPYCTTLARWSATDRPLVDFLHEVIAQNPDPGTRGLATLQLARLDMEEADTLEYCKDVPAGSASFEEFRTNYLASTGGATAESAQQQAKQLFEAVVEKYSNYPTLQPTNTWQYKATLGELAKAFLYQIEHLSVGNQAPEIDGKDMDGQPFKLSDYRGKVVVVSFWASWCGPCMEMVPTEVRLADKMKGQPFALVGVNGDGRVEDVKRAVVKNKMTWKSFCSTNGPNGPIPTAWNVRSWPTVFVLDANGVIRFKSTGFGPDTETVLDKKVDEILAEGAKE